MSPLTQAVRAPAVRQEEATYPRLARLPVRRLPVSPAAALAWGLLLFVCGQAALLGSMYTWRPQLRDPEYAKKLTCLRTQLADKPGRPLIITLGSSRVAEGFRPEALSGWRPGEQEPLVFNFALIGSGPVMELLCLNRLLADGIRPDWVVIEYWPPFCQQNRFPERNRIQPDRLDWNDLALLDRYYPAATGLRRQWYDTQWLPASAHRLTLVSLAAPDWLPWGSRLDGNWNGLDCDGWLCAFASPSIAQHLERVEDNRKYFTPIFNTYSFSELSDRALHEMLDRCREQGIRVALLFMPESQLFQSWYPPAVRADTDSRLLRLSQEYEAPVLDARDWMTEEEFIDSFHLHPDGAAKFTQRFGREMLRPLIEGKLRPAVLATQRHEAE